MKRIVLFLAIWYVLFFFVLYAIQLTKTPANKPLLKCSECQLLQVGSTALEVEIADTPTELEQGLSGRKLIGERSKAEGMLFLLPQRHVPRFWMVDMHFPLDILWIDEDIVVDLHTNLPFPSPGTSKEKLPLYAPKQPVTKVLEVPAGFIEENSIEIGTRVELIK